MPLIVSRYAIFAGAVVDLDAELRLQPAHLDVEVRLAHAVDHGLVGLLVARDAERRVLLAQPREPGGELVLVALGLRRDRVGEQRLGQLDGRQRAPGSSFVDHVSPVWACWSFATAPMSPAGTSGIDSCSLPRCVNSWPIRSSVLCVALKMRESGRTFPLNTRNIVMCPTNGSETVLNTKARERARPDRTARSFSSPPLPTTVIGPGRPARGTPRR